MVTNFIANLKGSALLLYGCDGEEATLPELGGAHSELKLGRENSDAVSDKEYPLYKVLACSYLSF